MSEGNESKPYELGGHYFTEIVMIIFFGVLLWFIGGMLAGYEIFHIHEWGMYWLAATIFVLPVVILIAIGIAKAAPKLAIEQNNQNPRGFSQRVVFLWLLISFVITLLGFLAWASNCC